MGPALIPPHDLPAEQALLGAALLDPEAATLVADLPPQVFYPESHRVVARGIGELVRRGEPIDLTTLRAELSRQGELERAGGDALLALLAEAGAISAHVESYLAIVREHATRRELIQLGTNLVQFSADVSGPAAPDLIGTAVSRLLALEAGRTEAIVSPASLAAEVRQLPNQAQGLSTGVSILDQACDGLQPGNLTVIAGRPGMGKTAMAVQIARHLSSISHHPVVFISLEMTRIQIALRFLSLEAGLSARAIRHGQCPPKGLEEALKRLEQSAFHVVEESAPSLVQVQAHLRRAVGRHRVVAAFVDHLGEIQVSKRDSRYVEVGEIARGLKATAKQLNIPVVALAQLNRKVEGRNSPRPQLSDLRDSGNIEEAANEVLFIWTPEERHERKDPLPVQLYLAKNRDGETGEVEYIFEKSRSRFIAPAERDEPDWVRSA